MANQRPGPRLLSAWLLLTGFRKIDAGEAPLLPKRLELSQRAAVAFPMHRQDASATLKQAES
jgi:hypothetical protein